MQTRSSDENSVCMSVCLSVRPSVTRVDCDKMVETSVQIYIPYERTFILLFRWSEIADFQPVIARSSSAVTFSEKGSVNANGKSTTRFPMSLRWSSYVASKSPKGGLKNANRPISQKITLRLKKVCNKVSSCEKCQRQSCKAFIGLANCAEMIGRGRPLVPEILDQSDRIGANRRFSIYFRS